MIELRGLHLGNVARIPAESVRPDLWPDHAWVPALGCTGGVLYDLCGGQHGAIVGGADWEPTGLDFDYPERVNYVTLPPGAARALKSLTIMSCFNRESYGDRVNYATYILSKWDAGANRRCYALMNNAYTTTNQFSFAASPDGTSTNAFKLDTPAENGVDVVLCGTVSESGAYLYRDGVVVASAAGLSSIYSDESSPVIGTRLNEGVPLSGTMDALLYSVLFFSRQISGGQVIDLTADPVLPFRRRQPVYYSVPSGGGASLAASSAWRVFTSAAIDTAWAIRAALDGATSWAVLTGSEAATGWRITAVSDAATGWRIAADLDADTAWNLRAASASPSAWRILTASEADTAWSIAADLSASTAWAILTSMDAATSWAIISAGTLLANTGWAIRTAADTDTGWRLKTDAAADTAWAVRNARDAATAWDIQAALARATAWRVTTDLQADTAWTVITDMDVDAAWNILRADPTGTAWRVCTDLDTPTSWAVFSDIIPEPVRVFLAPGRQFIINAASRVLIITKPRP